ncbi:MAG: ATP-binding cassette domain-containing protein [Streptosporangiales bacterium]|nr:ATP-binding cassette domain-containing protein [Streptosporangiales bacterium]
MAEAARDPPRRHRPAGGRVDAHRRARWWRWRPPTQEARQWRNEPDVRTRKWVGVGHVIEVHDVVKTYPLGDSEVVAVDHLSLDVGHGEFVAIVGRSGSGKTTLLNMLAGIDRPTTGTVHAAGADLGAMSESGLASWRGGNVGLVFQFFQLLPTLTVAENVMLPMDFAKKLPADERRKRAVRLLERVGIVDQADKLPATLSGGQQQRAAIARALANDPPLLLADEPTGNLDSHTADAVLTLFADLNAEGRTIVVVTHERDIRSIVSREVTLVDGRIVSDASAPAEVAE